MAADFAVDPAAPVFFMSYWRHKSPSRWAGQVREPNKDVKRLFDDLTMDVNDLIGYVPGRDPGFLDVAGGGGSAWRNRLLRAVGTCQVFVCLLSGPYLNNSQWCAREWHGFTRRRVVPRIEDADPDQRAIVPVLWLPIPGTIPETVSEVEMFEPENLPDPDSVARYRRDGLLGLLKTGQDDLYRAIVWRLAQQVERIRSSYWVEPVTLDQLKNLRDTFDSGEA